MESLLDTSSIPKFSHDLVRDTLASPRDLAAPLVYAQWHPLIRLHRNFGQLVSRRVRQGHFVSVDAFVATLGELETLFQDATDAMTIGRLLPDANVWSEVPDAALAALNAFPDALGTTMLVFERVFTQWREGLSASDAESRDPYTLTKIHHIKNRLDIILIEAILVLARKLEERRAVAGIEVVQLLSTFSHCIYLLRVGHPRHCQHARG